jgi:RecB family exonuclease
MSFEVIEFGNSAEVTSHVSNMLRDTRNNSNLTPVTFIAHNYRSGNALVNQFTRQMVIGEGLALAAIEQITATDLLSKLAQHLDIMWSFNDYSRSMAQVTSSKLFRDEQFGKSDKLMPSTVLAISECVAKFNWIDLESNQIYEKLSVAQLTPTSKLLLSFARDIQVEVNKTETKTPANLLKLISNRTSDLKESGAIESLGRVIQVDESLPETFSEFVQSIIEPSNFTVLRVRQTGDQTEVQDATITSFPDVFTEVRHAAKQAVEYLNLAGSALDVAILYSDSKDYATSLMSALDDAGIEWHGPSKDLPGNSRIAKLVKDILEYSASNSEQFLDRRTVMRAIKSRILINPPGVPDEFSWYKVERFIKSTGLFNNAEAWLPELRKTAQSLPDLLKELEEAERYPDETEVLESVNQKLDNAYSAQALTQLIDTISAFKAQVNSKENSINESQASEALSSLISFLIGNSAERKLPALDDRALGIIVEANNLGFGDVDEAGQNHGRALLTKITAALNTKGANKSGGGLFLGDLNQPAATMYKYLIVLGCSEGAMPKRLQEDPLIPDALKRELPSNLVMALPETNVDIRHAIASIKSVIRGAQHVSMSFSRGGLVGTGSGKVSPMVKEITSSPVSDVSSFEDYVDNKTNAVLTSDLQRKLNLQSTTSGSADQILIPELASALSLHSAQFTEYSGNLGSGTSAYVLKENVLSPSAVESYLKCPHKFLVSYGLSFKFEDETDEIEDYRANDFGTMAHAAWEDLFHECVKNGDLPEAGEPFTENHRNRFKEIFKSHVTASKNKGQAGWEPLFDERANQFIANVDKYFELEHRHRAIARLADDDNDEPAPLRDAFKLRPHLAEYSFDQDGLMYLHVQVPVTEGHVTMKFKGRMDRLDLSATGVAAGVLDFKTTAAARIMGNASELIQGLLYAHAMRNSHEFPAIKLVTFNYLTMKSEKESDLVTLHDVPWEILAHEDHGGMGEGNLPEAISNHNAVMDFELKNRLSRLAIAIEQGKFEPNPASASANYCEVCKALGKTKAKRISLDANPIEEDQA